MISNSCGADIMKRSSARAYPASDIAGLSLAILGLSLRSSRQIGKVPLPDFTSPISPFHGTLASVQIILRPDMESTEYHVIRLSFGSRAHREQFVWTTVAQHGSFQQFNLFHFADNTVE